MDGSFHCRVDGAPFMDVTGFYGVEAMSSPFHFHVDVVMADDWGNADEFLGAGTLLTIEGPAGPRHVHGMLDSVVYVGRRGVYNLYRLEIAPLLWYLHYIRQSRIFQDMTTPDIIASVLETGGIPSDRYRMALTRQYSPRNYCVQYRETDLDFIHRLMEDEGIFYFFEHAEDGHTLVIADDGVVHVEVPEAGILPFRDPSGLVPVEQSVSSFDYEQRIGPDRVTLKDYSYKQPDLDVSGTRSGTHFPDLELYDYPGEFVTPDLGEVFAEIRLGAEETRKWVGRGNSDCRNLLPGYLFMLTQHPDEHSNCSYLVTRVRHRGRQPQSLEAWAPAVEEAGYGNLFEVIPAETTFRPLRRTPRPAIPGVQTATVVGPPGEEIFTDDDGRIKVMFHWDRADDVASENRSCWIRVAQSWSGNQYGAVFVPRVGQEVVVQFLEGDPNRPLVTGMVYNRRNPAPYGDPDSNTRSTIKSSSTPGGGGFNEFRFEDAKGEEEVYLHAERDLNEVVLRNHATDVGKDRRQQVAGNKEVQVGGALTETITGDVTLTVEKGDRVTRIDAGDDALRVAEGDRLVRVEKGDHSRYVAGDRKTQVDGDDRLKIQGDREVKITQGDLALTVGRGDLEVATETGKMTITAKGAVTVNGMMKITLSVGPSSITISHSGVKIEGPMITSSAQGVHQLKGAMIKMN